MFNLSDSVLKAYNKFLCHLLYFPLAIFFTVFFTFINIFLMPIAYFKQSYILIQTLTDSNETMDDLSEKIRRLFTIIKFIFGGPIILIISIFSDMIIFLYNLYTEPLEFINDEDEKI